jgi:hypothetical protein
VITFLGLHYGHYSEPKREATVDNIRNTSGNKLERSCLGEIEDKDNVEEIEFNIGELAGIHGTQ